MQEVYRDMKAQLYEGDNPDIKLLICEWNAQLLLRLHGSRAPDKR